MLTKLGFVGICILWPYNNPIWDISHGLPITVPAAPMEGAGHCPGFSSVFTFLGEQIPVLSHHRAAAVKFGVSRSLLLSVLEIWLSRWGGGGTKSLLWQERWDLVPYRYSQLFVGCLGAACPPPSVLIWEFLAGISEIQNRNPPGMLCEQRILHRYRELS